MTRKKKRPDRSRIREWLALKINRIRAVFNGTAAKERQEAARLFESCISGDLIYSKMPLKDWEMAAVPDGHRCRPYLVLEKTADGVLAIPCTHKKPKDINRLRHFAIRPQFFPEYEFFKEKRPSVQESWMDLSRIQNVPWTNLRSWSLRLPKTDFEFILRINRIRNMQEKDLRPGDVISRSNRFWLLLQEKPEGFAACPLNPDKNGKIQIHRNVYEPVFRETQSLSDNGKARWFLYPSELKEIQKRYKKYQAAVLQSQPKLPKFKIPKPPFTFEYPPGSLLEVPFRNERYVYLCSWNRKLYGVSEEDYLDFHTHLSFLHDDWNYEITEQADPDMMDEIFEDLKEWHPSKAMKDFTKYIRKRIDKSLSDL